MPTINPFARPVYLMAKPAGSLCNLRCKYCYYLEKSKLYDNNEKHIMSDQLLDKFIKDCPMPRSSGASSTCRTMFCCMPGNSENTTTLGSMAKCGIIGLVKSRFRM